MLATAFILAPLIAASIANGLENVQVQPSKRQTSGITPLNSTEISSFKPYTFFASAAYCNSITTSNWSCGAKCDANSDFILEESGSIDDDAIFWYVGFSPSLATVIVAHQGTNVKLDFDNIVTSVLQDADALLESLDSNLFPSVDSSVEVHNGFAIDHAKTANDILSAVQTTITAYNTTQVTITGHSLGGAIALLDGVYLPLHIDNVSIKVITYGMPRVGNQAFADYIDYHDLDVTHINNKEDPVPILPFMDFGYHHPSGEVHIKDNDEWVSCPGQDNPSPDCIVGDIGDIFDIGSWNWGDHSGPYDDIIIGC